MSERKTAEKVYVVNGLNKVNPQNYPDLVQLNLADEGSASPWGGNLVLTRDQIASLGITIGDKIKITVSKSS